MLFSAKQKGFFIERDEQSVRMAVSDSMQAPMTVEQVRECPANDTTAISTAIKELVGKSSASLVPARCSIFPAQRLVRRVTLDLKRLRDTGYISEVLTSQFRIEPDKYTLAVLNASDGSDYDLLKATQKDALFCGSLAGDFVSEQDRFVELGIYPQRLELGTVSLLGATLNYFTAKQIKTPTLVLELSADSTQSFILSPGGVDVARSIPYGIQSMIPAVQKQLGLKDEESARKLFFSNAFDFTGLGGKLAAQLLKELHSSIGFFEVQTGQSVGQIFIPSLSTNLTWLRATLANALGFPQLECDMASWLEGRQIKIDESLLPTVRDPRWFSLFSLMIDHDGTGTKKD